MQIEPWALQSDGQLRRAQAAAIDASDGFALSAKPRDDLFFEPGTTSKVSQGTFWRIPVDSEALQVKVKVSVGFHDDFDSAALVAWVDPDHWAKVCAEIDPHGQRRVVSVVTNSRSDDANGPLLTSDSTWLRVSRNQDVFAFHASADGETWDLIRLFTFRLESLPELSLGLLVQSPHGDGVTATFEGLAVANSGLGDPRSQS